MGRHLEPIKHGTYGGYQAHRKRGQQPCEACVRAAATYRKAYNAKRRGPRKTAPSTYYVPVVCPFCTSDLEAVTQRAMKQALVARLRCTKPYCAHEFALRLVLAPVGLTDELEVGRCGSLAGYQRHVRAGEQACRSCLVAHSQVQQDRKRKQRQEVSA